MRRFGHETYVALLMVVAAVPLLPGTEGLLGSGAQAALFTLVAASLVLLTGWIGQISLAHAAFVGIGAFATGWASTVLGLSFPLSLPVAAGVAGASAALLGVVALRVRGLYLAVATLIFSWAASEFLFRQDWVLRHSLVEAQSIGTPGTLLHLDFSSRTVFYYVAWATAVAVLFALMNLRDSRTGRAFYAIRGSEMAGASLGIDVLRYKTLAFALSGAIAGIAGNLMITHTRVVSADSFDFTRSLFFLAIAVVGGLNSLAGAVAAALVFAAMEELFFQVAFLNEALQLVSALLLAVIFRAYPGGLAAVGRQLVERWQRFSLASRAWRRRLVAMGAEANRQSAPHSDEEVEVTDTTELPVVGGAWTSRAHALAVVVGDRLAGWRRAVLRPVARLVASDSSAPQTLLAFDATAVVGPDVSVDATPSSNGQRNTARLRELVEQRGPAGASYEASSRLDRRPLIEVDHVTVRFGGLTAVDDASLSVREGEITALIGPNGAGKTTLFNAIAGFNTPSEGRVRLHGRDVTGLPVHRRAQTGVSRTFQLIQLFTELTVFENLLTATHLQNDTGFAQHMAAMPGALWSEAVARQRVRQVIGLLALEDVADRPVAGLPFGTLRMVEVARALVMGSPLIMLDEPASGLDERETDELMEVVRSIRDLGASILLIEHDVRMVTAVSDFIYVLEQGRVIAEGTPSHIQRNEAVIAAYLGGAADTEDELEVATTQPLEVP